MKWPEREGEPITRGEVISIKFVRKIVLNNVIFVSASKDLLSKAIFSWSIYEHTLIGNMIQTNMYHGTYAFNF